MHRNCTHQYTDRQTHTPTHTPTHSHSRTHSLLEFWCHVLTSEWVSAVLSAELLEVLGDGVCGNETLGIMRRAQYLTAQRGQTNFTSQFQSCSCNNVIIYNTDASQTQVLEVIMGNNIMRYWQDYCSPARRSVRVYIYMVPGTEC